MKIILRKHNGVLTPSDPLQRELFDKLKEGEEYAVTVKKERNLLFHRKFFALLKIVFENMPEDHMIKVNDQIICIGSVDDLLWHIKMQLGYHIKRVTLGGKITYEADSISFAAMDEIKFSEFYSGAIDICLKYFLPEGTDRRDLEDQIVSFI